MTPGDRIRSRRAKRCIHSVEQHNTVCWQNVGWRLLGPNFERPGFDKIEWQGPDPAIPVNFDQESAVILRARGDLDDLEGVGVCH